MPTRRQFLQSIGTLATAATALTSCESRKAGAIIDNVLVIIGDDHSAEVLGCYGNEIIRTPNLDRMASRGVCFTSAYANAPLCSASRQSLLTGKYPHACGVTLLRTSFPEEQTTIAEHLRDHGFSTGIIGKTHFNNDLSHGFDLYIGHKDYVSHLEKNTPRKPAEEIETRPPWRPFQDPARIWLNADMLPSSRYDKDSAGTFYAQKAIEFLQKNSENRFCLWVGFGEPHSPFNFPIEYRGKYNPDRIPLPVGSPEDDRWVPAIFRDMSDRDKRGIIASYYTSVEYLDKNVGLILSELERLKLDKRTLVIYVGDQGYLLGDHKRFEKHMMWEHAVRSPFILQAGVTLKNNRRIDSLTEFVDIAPTVLELLDLPPLPEAQGKSLAPLLRGETASHKEYVFCEFLADNKAMVRSRRWKYIFSSGKRDLGQGYATGFPPPGITHRLYDLDNDPGETHDVAKNSGNRPILSGLQDELLRWFYQTHPKAEQIPADLTVEEKLVWFCEPPDKDADLDAK